jgi:hypothetical protein
MRADKTQLAAFAACALALSLTACDADSNKRNDAVGSIQMSLDVAPGESLATISYSVMGPGTFTKTGLIDVSKSATLSAAISPLPPGTGFTITLSGTSVDGSTNCLGAATFDVLAHQTTAVLVHLLCRQPTQNGSVAFNGALNVCPLIDGLSASPNEVFVGGSIALAAQAHDTDQGPSPLAYQWTTTTGGTLSAATSSSTTLSCTSSGPVTVTITVSDGDNGPGCPDTQSLMLTCTAPGTTGAAGVGAAGMTGAAGMGAGGTTGAAGTGAAGTGAAGTGAAGTGAAGTGAAGTGAAGTGAAGTGTAGAGASPDVVIYRVGDGSGALTSAGTPVFLDELATTTGALVHSTALPVAISGANHRLVASGSATSEGLLTLSTDGRYLIATGYDAAVGTASVAGTTSAAVARVVARIDASQNVDTTTALSDFSTGNNPRSAASPDGMSLWVGGGAGGVRSAILGGTTSVQLSTTVANIRQVNIFASQLYVSDSSGSAIRLGAVGTGLPTTAGQIITNLPGLSPSTGSPYAFFFADLDGTPGVDTLYLTDDGVGVTKYSLVGGSWTASGTVGAASDTYRGITGVASGATVSLWAVRKAGELVSIVDASGFNGALTATPTLLATAGTNTVFRGVALAPHP